MGKSYSRAIVRVTSMMSMISGHALKADVKAKHTVNGHGTWQKRLRPLVDSGGEQCYSTVQHKKGTEHSMWTLGNAVHLFQRNASCSASRNGLGWIRSIEACLGAVRHGH